MSIEEIINHLDVLARVGEDVEKDGRVRDINGANAAALREAIALLKTHPEAHPNEPLTLEELWEMDGQPVWVVPKMEMEYGATAVWMVVDSAHHMASNSKQFALCGDYGTGWIVYRRPPKED